MKRIILLILLSLATSWLPAQSNRTEASVEPAAGAARYTIGGEHGYGPVTGLRFALRTHEQLSVGITLGMGWRITGWTRTGSGELEEIPFRPADRLLRRMDGTARFNRRIPRLSLALGFLGPDVTVYFSEGDLRPYAGLGVHLVLFPYSETPGTIAAPYLRAGLDVRLRSGLSAFGEMRHAVGLSGLASPGGRSFREFSILALGVSFVPRFD